MMILINKIINLNIKMLKNNNYPNFQINFNN